METNHVKSFERRVEEIDNLIDLMLDLSHEDFVYLRGYAQTAVAKSDASTLVQQLQFHDVLAQRCAHIKIVHNWILNDLRNESTNSPAQPLEQANLLRLNQLQFQITRFEYHGTLREIFENPVVSSRIELPNGVLVDKALQVLDTKFSDAINAASGWLSLTLNAKLTSLYTLYSMHRERAVLEAYLQRPAICDEQILHAADFRGDSTSIDLF